MFRLDVSTAFEDPNILVVLPRYVKVVQNQLPAYFQIAKKTPASFSKAMAGQELWKAHEKALKEFEKLKQKIDEGKTFLSSVEKPTQSFLDLKVELGQRLLSDCVLCEHKCRVNRREKRGWCGVGSVPRIFGAHVHWGEEACISPSATLFHSGCNLRCVYCQNAPESTNPLAGEEWNAVKVAKWMERMEENCRNVNFVGGEPTPNLPKILVALQLYNGNLPVVWNSNAYCSEKTMRLLHGVVDLFLFDFRYFNKACAKKLSLVKDYPKTATRNHLLAAKQSELLIRLLVLPNHVECDAKPILEWVAKNLRENALVNVLGQYRPCWKASNYSDIARSLYLNEF